MIWYLPILPALVCSNVGKTSETVGLLSTDVEGIVVNWEIFLFTPVIGDGVRSRSAVAMSKRWWWKEIEKRKGKGKKKKMNLGFYWKIQKEIYVSQPQLPVPKLVLGGWPNEDLSSPCTTSSCRYPSLQYSPLVDRVKASATPYTDTGGHAKIQGLIFQSFKSL